MDSSQQISDERDTIQRLIESEERWRSITQYTPDNIMELDLEGNIMYINHTVPDLSIDEVIGKSIYQFVPEKYRENMRNTFASVLSTGESGNYETGYRDKKGNDFFFEAHVGPILNSGQIVGFIARSTDVTNRRMAEEKLKEIELRYRTTFEQSPDGIIILDLETTRALEFNNAICDILGYSREEFAELKIADYDIFEGPSEARVHIEKVLQQGRDDFDTKMRTKNGDIRDIHVIVKVIELSGKKYFQSIWRDITESKKTERKLKESEILYRTTVNGLQDYLHVINQDLELVLINNSLKQSIKDLNLDTNLIGKDINEVFPFLSDKVLDEYRSVFNNKSLLITVENSFIDKKDYTTETRKIPIFDDEENVIQIITIIRDITEAKQSEQKLKESEEFLRLIIDNAPVMFSSIDDKGKVLLYNKEMERNFGWTREEVYEMNDFPSKIFPEPGIKDIVMERIKESDGKFSDNEWKVHTKDGTIRTQLWANFRQPNGTHFSVGLDITDKKESEEKWKALSENSPAHIMLLDREHKILFINRTVPDLTKKEVIGTSVYAFIPQEFHQIARSSHNSVWKTGEPVTYSTNYITMEGDTRFLDVWIGPVFQSGNIFALVSHSMDVTEKTEAELKLRQSEERYRTFVQNIQGIAYQGYQDFSAAFFDGAVEEITGYTSQDFMVGRIKWNQIIYPDDAPIIQKKVETFYSTSAENDSREYRIIRKNGEIRWILEKVQKNYDYKKKIEGVQGIIVDITKRKKAENELKELNKLKSEFLRRASHELKTPLISIKGFSDLILSLYADKLDPVIMINLREINDGCERLQNIINNLLKTSRLESPDLKPKLQKEDLSFLIKFCVHELESLAVTRNQSIKLDIQNDLYANVEKEEIHDVVSNLLTNAIKYTPPRGKIEIKTETKKDHMVISVKDNGIGFTNEQKKKIFKQFGKIERYGQGLDLGIDGTGLGLYISKRIVESHGGKIWMKSEGKGKGSTFYFTLPIVK